MGGAGSPPGWNTAAPRRERSERGRGAGLTGAPLRGRYFGHMPPPAGSLCYRTERFARSAQRGGMRRAQRPRTSKEDSRRRDSLLARRVPLGSRVRRQPGVNQTMQGRLRAAGPTLAHPISQVAPKIVFLSALERSPAPVQGDRPLDELKRPLPNRRSLPM